MNETNLKPGTKVIYKTARLGGTSVGEVIEQIGDQVKVRTRAGKVVSRPRQNLQIKE